MEDVVKDLMNNGIAVELLVPPTASPCGDVGVRLRTFGKSLPAKRMILASAPTFEGALDHAVIKAEDGRWENLDWAARPWDCVPTSGAARYGL